MAAKIRREAERDRRCINEGCEYYNKTGSMVWHKGGKNGYLQCRRCRKGYSPLRGTLFYKKRVNPEEIVMVLKTLAEGGSIRGCERIYGHHRDTIIKWLKEAGRHSERVEQELIGQYEFNQVQVDELWTFIRKKTTHLVVKR